MNKVIRKGFWSPAKEEQWINEMAERGLSLINVRWMQYTFEDTQRSRYQYRIDFMEHSPKSDKAGDYIAFLEEAGIEVVSKYDRWLYLRKPTSEGPFDVYSDTESKIAYYKRMKRFWLAIGIAELYIGTINIAFNIRQMVIGESIRPLSMVGIILGAICLFLGLAFLLFFYRPIRLIEKKLIKERRVYD